VPIGKYDFDEPDLCGERKTVIQTVINGAPAYLEPRFVTFPHGWAYHIDQTVDPSTGLLFCRDRFEARLNHHTAASALFIA
jgi:hypothetical protein